MSIKVKRSEYQYACECCGERFDDWFDCEKHESLCKARHDEIDRRRRKNCPFCDGTGEIIDNPWGYIIRCPHCYRPL